MRENCQRCVYAAELSRRGYDVEALPKVFPDSKDPMFQNKAWQNGFDGQTWERDIGRNTNVVTQRIESKMDSWGDGARAIVYVQWKDGGTHVFNIENVNGVTVAYDAQSGSKANLKSFINKSMPSKTMISRVDNLSPNEAVLKNAVNKKGK